MTNEHNNNTQGEEDELYGLMARFGRAEDLRRAAGVARQRGYSCCEAYTPYPVPGLIETMGLSDRRVPATALLGALFGAALGLGLQVYSVLDYPMLVSGKPILSWPAFVIPTFALGVVGATLGAVFGMLACNRLPRLYHPVFNCEAFQRVSDDSFFLCIDARDPLFHRARTYALLRRLNPVEILEVEP